MHEGLEAIKDAWDSNSSERDAALARSLADAFVAENPHLFGSISGKTLEKLCADIDVFRAAEDMEEQVWLIETWLLHRFEPQKIGGTYEPQIRIPSGEAE